ncbi:MAG: thymidylate kinase [Clostridia bacterium]|nr:thymidylate kinase [Clostridia bacterium]
MAKTIVLEGIDGSGKSTQFALTREKLAARGLPLLSVKFPRYQTPSGMNIKRYLSGEFGEKPDDVGPYAASAFFAVDRYASFKSEWEGFYRNEEKGVVLLDRYTPSNAVHQGSKLSPADRPAFFDWLADFEYRLMGLPRPDAVLVLDMPYAYTRRLTRARGEEDIHERDGGYIEKCYETMLDAAAHFGWTRIPCVEEDEILPPETINGRVMEEIDRLLSD